MRLTEVFAANFRCFSKDTPLDWRVGPGLNTLVGENDSGKSAIIDAIRLVLGTRSEFYRLSLDDFYLPEGENRATDLMIRCSFEDLTDDEAASFIEWCSISERGEVSLHAVLHGRLVETKSGALRAVVEWRTGLTGDGPAIQGTLREHLRVTYLRPLRDAEGELSAGRRSRLSQILAALPNMKGQGENDFNPDNGGEPKTIAGIVEKADHQIKDNAVIGEITKDINNDYLADLTVGGEDLAVDLGIGSSVSLLQVLERLELALLPPGAREERVRRGLGLNNVLFMAAELLLLQAQSDQLPLLLVEEPEAHLHPQLQARFIQIMSERAKDVDTPVQIVLTTHSPLLASDIELEEMTMVAGAVTFPLAKGATWLESDDYEFLRRFLDATKANLFFAKGVLIVEGDAENLLLPALAIKLGRPLPKYGVSIVNVGHVGLFRYSRILRRKAPPQLDVPVACLADRDIPPDSAKPFLSVSRKTLDDFDEEKIAERLKKLRQHDGGNVLTYVSEHWTLEYDLAYAGLARELWQAIRLSERPTDSRETVIKEAANEFDSLGELSKEQRALKVYGHMLKERISKSVVAQHLAALVQDLPDDVTAFEARIPGYLVCAIKHVTPAADVVPERPADPPEVA